MRRALEEGLVAERLTFHDIRAKAGSDSEDESLLGHQVTWTLRRRYKRKPLRVKAITANLVDI